MTRKLATKEYAYVEVEVVLAPPNKMAILVKFADKTAWIPKSLIESSDPEELAVGKVNTLLLPTWIVEERGLEMAVVGG